MCSADLKRTEGSVILYLYFRDWDETDFTKGQIKQECLVVEGIPSVQHTDYKNIYRQKIYFL